MAQDGSNTPKWNEAELQVRLVERIRAVLPLLPPDVRVERYLNLRLGHHKVVVDGVVSNRHAVSGRYDVLLMVDGEPLLVVELKGPDVAITDEDVLQGLSYARTHEPLVPLVLVTNGNDSRLHRSYDGEKLNASEVGAEQLTSALNAASSVAAGATRDAIRTLLGATPEIWERISAVWTADALTQLTGEVSQFRAPLARGFWLPRACVAQILQLLAKGEAVVALHGPPLSGITNVLAALAGSKGMQRSLLVDTRTSPDVLQSVANRLSYDLSFPISKDDVRGWLHSRRGLVGLVLVLDGVPSEGFEELVELARAKLIQLVVGMNSEVFRQTGEVAGRRQATSFGRERRAVELLPLSDAEFESACEVIGTSFRGVFFHGAHHTPEFRLPRVLRALVATLPKSIRSSAKDAPGDAVGAWMLPAVATQQTLHALLASLAPGPQLAHDLELVAAAFLEDAGEHAVDVDWLLDTWGLPSISPGVAERVLGDARIARLLEEGYLSWLPARNSGPLLLIRIEELLLWFVGKAWSNGLQRSLRGGNFETELEALLALSARFPRGEIALALAITAAGTGVLSASIPQLYHQRPVASRLKEGAEVALLLKGKSIRLHFGEGMDEEVLGEVHPWLVLSHVATYPMGVDGIKSTANLSIFRELGASRHLIYQPVPAELAEVRGLHVHEVDGIGTVLCFASGIVEPLVQAMVDHAHRFPQELVDLATEAVNEKEVHLAWRVLMAAYASRPSADAKIASAATEAVEVIQAWWGKALDDAMAHHATEPGV